MRHTKENITSKYLGVSFATTQMAWRAQIMLNYRNLHLGYFSTESQAKRAYDIVKELAKDGLKISSGMDARKLLKAKSIIGNI